MKKLFIILILFISGMYGVSIEDVNSNIDKLVSSINKGDTNQSNILINWLSDTLDECDFDEMKKRMEDGSYIAPFIKELPKSLEYDTFINKEDELRDKFHQIFQAIEDVQNNIALKKYTTALKIVITGFSVYKSTIDLIKTDYDLYELIQLPSNLSDTVDGYKKDAQIIEQKFNDIQDEKKKLEYLEDFKNKLVELTYKIRDIRAYLYSKEDELTKISAMIKSCNNAIDALNHTEYIKFSENSTSADVSKYAQELNYLKTALLSGKIGIDQYKYKKEQIKNSIDDICSKVDECNGADQIVEDYFQYCYTRDPAKNECVIPDPDSDDTYYPLVLKISDENSLEIKINPTRDDFDMLLLYKNRWDGFLSLRDEYLDKFDKLISAINESDFLLEGSDYTQRPIELTEVDVHDEFDPLFNGNKPPECSSFDMDGNFSNSVAVNLYNSSHYSDKTPSKGPNILCDTCYSNEQFFYNNDLTKVFWQNKMEDYFSYLQEYIKSLYYTATMSYSSKPNCINSFDHCKFAILLLPENKIEDIAYDIKKLSEDAIDFSDDFKDMSQKLSNIKSLANDLIGIFQNLKNYENSIGYDDFNFKIVSANSYKTKLFLHSDMQGVKLLDSYYLLNIALSSVEDAKVEAIRLQNLSSAYFRDWMDRYYDKIEDIVAFNHKLNDRKSDLLNEVTQLSDMKNYTALLDSLKKDISFLLGEIRSGKKDLLYETAKNINDNYQSFIGLSMDDYVSILKDFTDIFTKIAQGDAYNSKDIFGGDYPVDKKYADLISKMLEYYWPICMNGYGREDTTFKNYLNYDALVNKLPRVKELIETYYKDEYKPSYLNRSDIVIEDAKASPLVINGKGKISFYVKFKKLSGTFQPMSIELATAMPEENYIIKAEDGYYALLDGEIKGKYYAYVNDKGEYRFTFDILSDQANIYDTNGEVFDTIPIKDIYIRVYMRSDETPYVKFDGEDKNAFMFHIINLKYYSDLDKNGNGIDDEWEKKYDINSANEDNDNDALSNKEEYLLGTNPNNPDSDGDGISDKDEVKYGLDPLDPDDALSDNDKDGISNIDEIKNGFDPNDKNSPSDIIYATANQSDDDKILVDFYINTTKDIYNKSVKIYLPEGFTYDTYNSLIDDNISCNESEIDISKLQSGQYHIAQMSINRIDDTIAKFVLPIKCDAGLYGVTLRFDIPKTAPSYTFDLQKGWHMLANPFIDDINVSDFDKAEIVWAYNDNNWSGYSKKYDLKIYGIKKLEKIKSNDGFWVYLNHQNIIKVKGETFGKKLFETADKGWNLKGSKIDVSTQDLGFLFPDLEIVWAFKDGKWKAFSTNKMLNEEIENKIEILKSIDRYEGFWMLVK